MRDEQTARVAVKTLFPEVWKHKHYFEKDEYIYNHIKRMQETLNNQETLTPYDISRISQYYDKVMAKKYKLGEMVTRHDPKRKLRF